MVNLIVNTADPQQDGLLFNFFSSGKGLEQDFVKNDTMLYLVHRPVVPSVTNIRPWDDDWLSTDTFQVAIGNPDTPPTGGTFALGVQHNSVIAVASVSIANPSVVNTTGAHGFSTGDVIIMTPGSGAPNAYGYYWTITKIDDTNFSIPVNVTVAGSGGSVIGFNTTGLTALAYNISAATLQTALSAVSVTEGYGALIVTLYDTGNYQIAWSNLGAVPVLYGGGGGLVPACTADVFSAVAGSATTRGVQSLELQQQPVAYCEPAFAFTPAAVNATVTQAGSSGSHANKIYAVIMTTGTYAGTFSITITTIASVITSFIVAGTIAADDLQSLLNTAGGITSGDIAVTRVGDTLNIQFQGTQKESNAPLIAVTNIDLVSPLGVTGFMNLNTINLFVAFAQTTSSTLDFTFAIRRTRTTGEESEYFQHRVTLKRNLIDPSTMVGITLPQYYTKAQVDALFAEVFDGTNLIVGTRGRFVPITNGFKIQTSTDGVTWVDGPSYTP